MPSKNKKRDPAGRKILERSPLDRHPTSPGVSQFSRKWLSSRPKEELVDLILDLNARLTRSTSRVAPDTAKISIDLFADGLEIDLKKQEYTRLPDASVRRRKDTDVITIWRICMISSTHNPLGLAIYDDVFIGRKAAGIAPDLDLTKYDAEKLGVSRQHALLRPTDTGLLLIDLGSRNGTFYDGKRIEEGTPKKLKDKATISFGRLHFMVRFAGLPGDKD